MYAILRQGGRQYRVSPGDIIQIDLLGAVKGDEVELGNVLMVNDGSGLTLGLPRVEGVAVKARVLREARGRKITVFKYKRRKGYSKKQGHRQDFTEVQITGILKNGESLSA
jgi:large subunit ribosomal protein L21